MGYYFHSSNYALLSSHSSFRETQQQPLIYTKNMCWAESVFLQYYGNHWIRQEVRLGLNGGSHPCLSPSRLQFASHLKSSITRANLTNCMFFVPKDNEQLTDDKWVVTVTNNTSWFNMLQKQQQCLRMLHHSLMNSLTWARFMLFPKSLSRFLCRIRPDWPAVIEGKHWLGSILITLLVIRMSWINDWGLLNARCEDKTF